MIWGNREEVYFRTEDSTEIVREKMASEENINVMTDLAADYHVE